MHSSLRASCPSFSIGDHRRRQSAACSDLALPSGGTHITSSALRVAARPSDLQQFTDETLQHHPTPGPRGDDSASCVHSVTPGDDSAEGGTETAAGRPRAAIITSPHASRVMQRKMMVGVRCPEAGITEELHVRGAEAIQHQGGKPSWQYPAQQLEATAGHSSSAAATAAEAHSTAAAHVARVNARKHTAYSLSSSSSTSSTSNVRQRQQVQQAAAADQVKKLEVVQVRHDTRPAGVEQLGQQGQQGQDAADDARSGFANPRVPCRVTVVSTLQDEEQQGPADAHGGGPLHKDGTSGHDWQQQVQQHYAAAAAAAAASASAAAAAPGPSPALMSQPEPAEGLQLLNTSSMAFAYPKSQLVPPPGRSTTRIATFNLENFTWNNPKHTQKLSHIADTILASGARLVALQEVRGGRTCMEQLLAMLRFRSQQLGRTAHKWRWSISANLYAAGPGVPEYAAYIWDESQGVEPWLPEHEGRGSFWLLDQSERPQRQLSYLRSPYYGLFSVARSPVLLINCHLEARASHTEREVRNLPMLLKAAEEGTPSLLVHATAVVLGDFNLGEDKSWWDLDVEGYRGVLDRVTPTNTSGSDHYDNIYCMHQEAAIRLASYIPARSSGPRLVAVPVPGAEEGAAELGVVMDLPPPVSQAVSTQLSRSQTAGRLYPNHRLVFADFTLVGSGDGDVARQSLKMFGQPRMRAD